jgi:pimeloyl-ACP methyl ester carboxylesterase
MRSPPRIPFRRLGVPRFAAIVTLLVLVGACAGGGSSEPANATWPAPSPRARTRVVPSRSPLEWRKCDGGECARLGVPLDDAAPEGKQIELALLRVPARDREHRIGALLANPGGPGASGVEFARALRNDVPATLRDRFDIVGWDPRGTGDSTHVDCGTDLDYLFELTTAPADDEQRRVLEAAGKRLADECRQLSGDLLAHISSLSTVRDMDRIRAALNEDKLTFLGFSYGTYLGALYAQTFPDRVRAFVLDGAIDPALTAEQSLVQQAQGFELALHDFLADCSAHTSCAFHSRGDAVSAFDALDARLTGTPLRVHGRVLSPAELDLGISAALYRRDDWGALADALAAASKGDGSGLLELFDSYVSRAPDGSYSNEWPAFVAISCLDGPVLGDAAAYEHLAPLAAAPAPHFGASNVGLGIPCAFWPVAPVGPVGAVHAPGAPPILVIGTTGDPATPIAWSQALAAELGSGHLLVHEGEGHTAFLNGNTCVEDAVVAYLVDQTVPPDGTVCR